MNNLSQVLNIDPTPILFNVLVFNLILSAICSHILSIFYNKFGSSLSNKQILSKSFLPIAVTTTLVITVIKSSLALSLGLVGALSIVRFRAAIKEPEELAYLFLAISLGLGFGANQHLPTLTAFIIILILLFFQNRHQATLNHPHMLLAITLNKGRKKIPIDQIIDTIKPYCEYIDVKKIDIDQKEYEFSALIKPIHPHQLETTIHQLQTKFPRAAITLLDQSGITV